MKSKTRSSQKVKPTKKKRGRKRRRKADSPAVGTTEDTAASVAAATSPEVLRPESDPGVPKATEIRSVSVSSAQEATVNENEVTVESTVQPTTSPEHAALEPSATFTTPTPAHAKLESKTPQEGVETPEIQLPVEPRLKPRRRRLYRFSVWTMDLHIVRLFLFAYGICAFSFLGLFVLVEAFAKLDRFLSQDTNVFLAIFQYGVAMVPTVYTYYMGPIITLAAAMFTLTTLNRQNELTPLKAAGVSLYRVCLPIFFLAILFAGFSFYLQEKVIPSHKQLIREALSLARGKPLRNLVAHDRRNDYLVRAAEYWPTERVGRDVYVEERYPNGSPQRRIDAHQMEWIPEGSEESQRGHWILHNASIQRWDQSANLIVNASASQFERLKELHTKYRLDSTVRPIDLETNDLEISYLSWKELKTQYHRQPNHRHLAVKLHHHFAFPLSHVILLLLGIPFILNGGTKNQFISLAMAFAICAAFHITSSISMNIANHSAIFSPVLAAWLPVLLFGSLGITLFDHLPT